MTHTPDAFPDPAGDNMYADPEATGLRGDNPYTDPAHTGIPDDNLYTHPEEVDETGNIYSDPADTSHMRSTDQINAGIFDDGNDDLDDRTVTGVEETVVTEEVYDDPDYGTVVEGPASGATYDPTVVEVDEFGVAPDVTRDPLDHDIDDLGNEVPPRL